MPDEHETAGKDRPGENPDEATPKAGGATGKETLGAIETIMIRWTIVRLAITAAIAASGGLEAADHATAWGIRMTGLAYVLRWAVSTDALDDILEETGIYAVWRVADNLFCTGIGLMIGTTASGMNSWFA